MKKKLLVCVMALAAVFAVTGCKKGNNGGETTTTQPAEKKIACSYNDPEDGSTLKVTVTYSNDKIKKAIWSDTEKFKDDKSAKKDYEKNAEEIKTVNKNKGVSASCSYSGTLSTKTVTFTVADLDEEGKKLYEEMFNDAKDLSYEDFKADMAKTSFKCTES